MEIKTRDAYPSRIHGKPALMDRKDPVIHNSTSIQNTLTQDQRSFYEKNGYLFLESFFNEEEVNVLKNELKNIWDSCGLSDQPEIIREPESQEIRSIFAVHKDNDIMGKVANNVRIVDMVKNILGSQVYIHQSRINFKRGFTGKEFYWHSDFETWHVEDGMPDMRALSCSIALEDNYAFNGPLMVIPGSHRQFLSCIGEAPDEHYKQSLRKQEYGIPDEASLKSMVEQGGIVAPTGKAGSILLFDCNLMHGSNSNITPYSRSNVFIVYNSVDNQLQPPFSGKKPRPEYIAARKH